MQRLAIRFKPLLNPPRMGRKIENSHFLREAVAVLAAFVHTNHTVYLSSSSFTPTCNVKSLGC
ncbi:hypothetical protein DLR66_07830 [Vibrio paracholerae]|nr:hypothetical protein DLR66_07830 [Vibrio paracholerae]RBM81177.1 hypothetical protein DLR68_01560 [Vibrio paracholerae]RBM87606.1 hypothetical protein DLR73_09175 [Vibrio paracholerae]